MSKSECGCGGEGKKIVVHCGSSGEIPPAPRYSCVNGQCIPDSNGAYTSLAACHDACRATPPQRYSCVNGQCLPDSNGSYSSLAACQEACRKTSTPPTLQCSRVRVTFVSLTNVADDGDNGNGDWELQFDVNGYTSSHSFPDDEIDDTLNLSYPINKSIEVPIDQFTSELKIHIGGIERDGGLNGGDDALASVDYTFYRGENFGIGRTHDLSSGPSGGDRIGGYTVRVRIECLANIMSVVSLSTLRLAALWGLERENRKREKSGLPSLPKDDAVLLDRSIRYLKRKGWELKTIQGENFMFEGIGNRIDLRTTDPRSKSSRPRDSEVKR